MIKVGTSMTTHKYTTYVHVYIFTYLLIFGLGGGPVEQPPLAPNEKALYQPKPHPSNRTVISPGRLTKLL